MSKEITELTNAELYRLKNKFEADVFQSVFGWKLVSVFAYLNQFRMTFESSSGERKVIIVGGSSACDVVTAEME